MLCPTVFHGCDFLSNGTTLNNGQSVFKCILWYMEIYEILKFSRIQFYCKITRMYLKGYMFGRVCLAIIRPSYFKCGEEFSYVRFFVQTASVV
jgi:hypothetical protein